MIIQNNQGQPMRENSISKHLHIPAYKVIEISSSDKELHIYLRAYKRKKAICSHCGMEHRSGYHSSSEVIVEDLPLFEKRVYLHVPKRYYRCSLDGRIHVEDVSWLKLRSRVTKRFGNHIYRLTSITTNQEAGWFMGMDDEKVYRIDKDILEEKASLLLEPPPAAIHISVDEVSYRKYHRYLTNVIDTDERKVIWNDKGRKAEVLDRYYEGIGAESCKKIESVALDGAKTYISSTKNHAVNALIVYDKFHIMQKLNGAVDTVRKAELNIARRDENKDLVEMINCKQRFVLLKNRSKLTEKQSKHLENLCEINKPIYKAMLLKESFLEVYLQENIDKARECLEKWINQAATSSLKSFQELAASFTEKMQYILNWFHKRISSSISEGFNNKIKRLKRMAYGYKNITYFRLKIHQHCGRLNPRIAS